MSNVIGFIPKAHYTDSTDVFLSDLLFNTIRAVVFVPSQEDPEVGIFEVPEEILTKAKATLSEYLVRNGWLQELMPLAQAHFGLIVSMFLSYGSALQSDLRYDCFASMYTEEGYEPRISYYFTVFSGYTNYASVIITPTYLVGYDTIGIDIEGYRTALVGRPIPKIVATSLEPGGREETDIKDLLELFVSISKLDPGGVEYNPRLMGETRDGYRFDRVDAAGDVFVHLNNTISFHESIQTSVV